MPRKTARKKAIPKSYLLLLVFTYVILYVSCLKLGDFLILRDRLSLAKSFYTVAKMLNPFDKNINKRILASNILLEQGKVPLDEESMDYAKDKIATVRGRSVLGAKVEIPVLMYHYIRVNPYPTDTVGFGLSVTPYDFDQQMAYLKAHDYHTISLDDLSDSLLKNKRLPSKPIIITFDDGYKDLYTDGYPILKKYGLSGVSFVITGVIDTPRYLSTEEIIEMHDSRVIDFEPHTVNHSALTYLSDSDALRELLESKDVLSTITNDTMRWFAYPYGNVDQRVADLVKKAGYTGAFGTKLGAFQSTDEIFTLPRIKIGGGNSVASFAAILPWQ